MQKTNELDILTTAVLEAGNAIADMRREGVTVSRKENHDVLTQADLLANQILKTRLQTAFPDTGWLSEESIDDEKRLHHHRVWVVDPIDGTREYIAGVPEYAVSAALVTNGTPELACVYNPETRELFSALRGGGTFLNGHPVRCKQICADTLVLLASRSECKRGDWRQFSGHEIIPTGSIAYKLGLVAAGAADATFSLGPKSEWDIAAGVLLVSEAGGIVTDKNSQHFQFNQPHVKVDGIIAVSRPAAPKLLALLKNVRR
jgi:myo-inositol-1(or 4)-monophosphatase